MTTHDGCQLPPPEWAELNRTLAFGNATARARVAPFPPVALMQNVSGLTNEQDFASHGADFWLAFSASAPKPLAEYATVLDFGCGCGRMARMLKGHPGRVFGCDIDERHIRWIGEHLPYVEATQTQPDHPLPYATASMDLVISISVFTHLNERSQDILLSELHRVSRPGGTLMLTIHGERALERVRTEQRIWDMVSIDRGRFEEACRQFAAGRHAFVLQQGHLTTAAFQYGITFVPGSYVANHWGRWFDVRRHVSGALHDFQDLLVLEPR